MANSRKYTTSPGFWIRLLPVLKGMEGTLEGIGIHGRMPYNWGEEEYEWECGTEGCWRCGIERSGICFRGKEAVREGLGFVEEVVGRDYWHQRRYEDESW